MHPIYLTLGPAAKAWMNVVSATDTSPPQNTALHLTIAALGTFSDQMTSC
jgi:hypothetical protein